MTLAIKPRPTIYQGITMRSRTEAAYAAWLDRWCLWEYEPLAWRDGLSVWLPDFVVEDVTVTWRREPVQVLVDVKWLGWTTEANEFQRRRVLHKIVSIFDSNPTAVVLIDTPDPAESPMLVLLREDGTPALVPALWSVGIGHRPVLAALEFQRPHMGGCLTLPDVQPALPWNIPMAA